MSLVSIRRSALRRLGAGVGVVGMLGVACGAARVTGPSQGAPLAPNEVQAVARVVSVRAIDSVSLGIQPPQTLCGVTVRIQEVLSVTGPVSPPRIDEELEALARDFDCTAKSAGTQSGIALNRRVVGGSERWWLVRQLER
jgi:hypothetical protein